MSNLIEDLKQAVRDLIKQNAFGVEMRYASTEARAPVCAYLTDAGNSCIIGQFFKRQFPDTHLASLDGTVLQVFIRTALRERLASKYPGSTVHGEPTLTNYTARLLDSMQVMHDEAARQWAKSDDTRVLVHLDAAVTRREGTMFQSGKFAESYVEGWQTTLRIYREVINEFKEQANDY